MGGVPRNAAEQNAAEQNAAERDAWNGTWQNGTWRDDDNYSLVSLWGLGRDHRTVAWAPGGDGLVENRRALESGTAARATTLFGSDPNPATPHKRDAPGNGVTAPDPRLSSIAHPAGVTGLAHERSVPRNAPKGFRATSTGMNGTTGQWRRHPAEIVSDDRLALKSGTVNHAIR
jgi:hypothetical protein